MTERIPTSPPSSPRRAALVAVPPRSRDETSVATSLAEMERLLAGLGIVVVHRMLQRRDDDEAPSLGPGKLRELAASTGGRGVVPRGPAATEAATTESPSEPLVDLVVVDAELPAPEQRRLAAALGVDVLDRTSTILRVFEQRARTREAKLEIEMARLRYEAARTRESSAHDDREGGGGRGERGHANAELAKQRLHKRLSTLQRELDVARAIRGRTRERRSEIPKVALLGYTNAGKSSLMRALTGSEVYVDDKLFATLDTTVRAVEGITPRVLVTDTVGFLEDLPHDLIASFRSTLDEAADATLLLFVLDASDPRMEDHLRVTTETIGDLAPGAPRRIVLNKIDRVDAERRAELRARFPTALFVSAYDPASVAALRETIATAMLAEMLEAELRVPYARGEMLGEVHAHAHVVQERYEEDGIGLRIRASPTVLARLERSLAR